MKKIIMLSLILLASCAEKKQEIKQVAEISCGQCKFDLESQNGCDLAVRLEGKAYFMDGANIDDFGDAHDKHTGFCNVIRKAEVTGVVEEGRFIASSVKLIE